MVNKLIAPYVLEDEYRCHCCNQLPPQFSLLSPGFENLFREWARLRYAWGRPITIKSGYRCPEHNKAIRGSYLSVHLFGLALDCKLKTAQECQNLYRIINEKAAYLRVGLYKNIPTLLHLDVGYYIYPKASVSWIRGQRWVQ